MTCGGVMSGNCATGRIAQQIRPASTMMIAIEDAKTGRSMKNLTIHFPRGARAHIATRPHAVEADSGPGPESINVTVGWDIGQTMQRRQRHPGGMGSQA